MGVYTNTQGNWLTRRGVFLVALIGFHIAFFIALKSGLAVKIFDTVMEPIKAEIINEVIEEPPPPPPPEVQMELPPVQVPPVLVDIQLPPPPPTAIQAPITTEVVPPAPPPPPTVTRSVVMTKPTLLNRPDIFEYYPETSKSMGEQGTAKVRLCINAQGRVASAETQETSGHKRLDDAAERYAKAFRFRPGTTDGKPTQGECFLQSVKFVLNEQ